MFGNFIDVEVFPNIRAKLPLLQREAISSRPVIMCQKMHYVLENTMQARHHAGS